MWRISRVGVTRRARLAHWIHFENRGTCGPRKTSKLRNMANALELLREQFVEPSRDVVEAESEVDKNSTARRHSLMERTVVARVRGSAIGNLEYRAAIRQRSACRW